MWGRTGILLVGFFVSFESHERACDAVTYLYNHSSVTVLVG